MKILVLAGFSESLIRFRGDLFREMVASGHQVYAVAPDIYPGDETYQALHAMGVIPQRISMKRAGVNPFFDVMTFLSILLLLIKVRPSLMLAYTIKPVVYGIFAAWIVGVRTRVALITGLGYSFTSANSRPKKMLKKIVKSLYKLSASHATKVFFQNPDDEVLFRQEKILPDSVPSSVVNGSGIDVNSFLFEPVPDGNARFLLIARLLGDKGVREYVAAATRLKQLYPEVECQLVGWIDENPDAISQDELDEWVEKGWVIFLGRLDDVRSAISASTVYVLPSYREGTPRTVLEAMSIGRAVITTDAPGCRETVVNGHNGFLVPVRDADALFDAMRTFVENPDLAKNMGQKSREIAVDKYDVRKVNAYMLEEMGLL